MGAPEELYRKPRTKFVASFLAAVNWVGETGVRPECIRMSRIADAGAKCRRAVIESASFLGPALRVAARLESGDAILIQLAPNGESHRAGEVVYLSWNDADEMRGLL
jgi:putative spermidine/putrescine transport system ATP-binding protein